jgi:hypothetical protein
MRTLLNLLLYVCFFLFLLSCKKNENETKPAYFVKYKLNGVLVTNTGSNHIWLQPNGTDPSKTDLMLVSTTNDFKNSIGITIQKAGPIVPGTYQFGNSAYTITADYFQDQGTASEKIYTVENAPNNPPCSFAITYSSITNSDFKGTFSGNYFYGGSPNEIVTITEGEFWVRRNP